MVAPFVKSPLGGLIGVTTFSIYRLDPTGNIPLRPVVDLVPGFTGNRFTADMVESENYNTSFDITDEAIQDFGDATVNVHKNLDQWSVVALLTATMLLPAGIPIPALGGLPGVGVPGSRLDKIRADNLRAIANAREPIMAVTPERSMPRAWIESVSEPWTPEQGHVVLMTVNLKECRIVSPIDKAAIPDVDALAAGNAGQDVSGSTPAQPIDPGGGTPPISLGVGPT